MANIEGKQPVCLRFLVELDAAVYQRQIREHLIIRHSLLEIGYSVSATANFGELHDTSRSAGDESLGPVKH